MGSRISKIHEKEFEVLPQARFLLHEAHGRAGHLMVSIRSVPNLQQFTSLEFEAFLKDSKLSDLQKDELRDAPDQFKYYSEALFWIDLSEAHSAQIKLNNYIIQHRIFMTPELREGFTTVSHTLFDALLEYRQWKEHLGARTPHIEYCEIQ